MEQNLKTIVSESVPEWVIMRGVVYPGHEKAPFTLSGHSFRGCLAYDSENDLLQCHECGKWFESLASHIRGAHPISVREYKHKHWLRQGTSLINRRIQASLQEKARDSNDRIGIATKENGIRVNSVLRSGHRVRPLRDRHSYYEKRNEKGTCHAQLLKTISEVVAAHGRTPATQVFQRAGIHLESIFDAFGVSGIPELMDRLGYGRHVSEGKGGPGFPQKYSDDDLLDSLRNFYVSRKRLPKDSEWGYGIMPSEQVFRNRFGSRWAAYEKAGLGLVFRGRAGVFISSEDMLQAIRRFHETHGRTPLMKDFSSATLPFGPHSVRNRFGSIRAALVQAGIDLRGSVGGAWNSRTAPETIRCAFLSYMEEHEGQLPSTKMIIDGVLGVSFATVRNRFGTIDPSRLLRIFTEDSAMKVA